MLQNVRTQSIQRTTKTEQENNQSKERLRNLVEISLSIEQMQSTIKHFKICSACLTTRKMQIKVTLRFPLTRQNDHY